ncbi:carbohydrate esterase [Exiguobacterium sp. SH31]|uniref:alpha/beta hydrolase n=1 Tax=Exiguobacterium sp. SH31 TaxID=1843183 RepID=UPI0008C66679|nr:alpha/beta hydrolase-fold protein [Exiguobacterium sp. SH31]OGX79541.1 carbohydrate esterase [Exiguobacterium sp. SH31]
MIETRQVTITPFERERTVRIYTPNDYELTDKRYPVLYMHDGQNAFDDADASNNMSWRVGEYLDASKRDLIVVAIDSAPGEMRLDEYGPWENPFVGEALYGRELTLGGQGSAYIEYIAQELKPMIDDAYRTKPDETGMIGSSMGGLISVYAACVYPDIFKRVASLSSAFWFNQTELEQLIESSDLKGIERLYMDVGRKEVEQPSEDGLTNEMYLESSERVYALLRDKVDHLRFEVIEEGVHNELAWRERFPMVVSYLFSEDV